VAIPEGKLSSANTLSQAESHGIKKRAEIAEQRNLIGKNHFMGKYQDQEDKERRG